MKASKAFLQRLSRRSEDNRAFEDDNETAYSMDIDNVDRAPWSEGVLSSQDILGRIFRQLSLNRPEGFSADGVCRYALVCRAWRKAARQLPLAVEMSHHLTEEQLAKLRKNKQQLGTLSFALGDPAAMSILLDPDFASTQGKSLVSLNTSSVNEDGRPLDLSQYPNLEKLFLHCDTLSMDNASALKPSPPVSFSSKEVAHLKRLQVLSLRAFTTLDLRFLPPSIQVLYVSRSALYSGDPTQIADGQQLLPEPLGPVGLKLLVHHNHPFPANLRLQQVIVNSKRGGWLGEPLVSYFTVAQSVTSYGHLLLVRDPAEEGCRQFAQFLMASSVERLKLEFDLVSVIMPRVPPGRATTETFFWQYHGLAEHDLNALLTFYLPAFSVELSDGKLFKHCITASRK